MEVEVAVLGPVPDNCPYGLRGRKATLNLNLRHTDLKRCIKVEVAVLGSCEPVWPSGKALDW